MGIIFLKLPIFCFYYHYYRSVNQFLISKILPVQNKSISQWTLENGAGEGEETWELEGSKGHRALNFTQLASSFLPPCESLKEGNEGPHSTFKGRITSFKVSKLPTIVFVLDAKHCSVIYHSQTETPLEIISCGKTCHIIRKGQTKC